MKKKKTATLKHLDIYEHVTYLNQALQSPVSNIENSMVNSALVEQAWFTHNAKEQLKSLNTFEPIQSAAAVAAQSYAQSVEPINAQFQSVAAAIAQSYTEAFAPLNDQLSEMMKQLKLSASTSMVQVAESVPRFNELYALELFASFTEVSKNLNQNWTDAWNQNFGA